MHFFEFYKTEISKLLNCDPSILKFWWNKNELITGEYIVYQTEILDWDHKRSIDYFEFMNRAKVVYDYSVTNLKWNPRSIFRPYLPNIPSTVNDRSKDIEVLFYGGLSDRRKGLIEKLSKTYNVIAIERFSSMQEQEDMITRSKYILSIGFADNDHNDLFRITPALNLGANILAEHNNEIWTMDYLNKYFKDRIKIIDI